MVNSVVYTNDPLDRPVKQVSTEPGATITYDFTYVGVTNALSKEALSGTTTSTKPYAHDAFGRRATIAETVGATTSQYSYLYDPHTSVSLLIDQANTVKESYGYAGYGAANAALSRTAAGFSNKTNPYRYTRWTWGRDTGTSTPSSWTRSGTSPRKPPPARAYGSCTTTPPSNNRSSPA